MIDGWGISCELALRWMSLHLTDDKSTLVQVMAWCRQQEAITWTNVDPDLCRHMASLGHNELTFSCKYLLLLMVNNCNQITSFQYNFNSMKTYLHVFIGPQHSLSEPLCWCIWSVRVWESDVSAHWMKYISKLGTGLNLIPRILSKYLLGWTTG